MTNETNRDPFALVRQGENGDEELFALRAELDRLNEQNDRLYHQIEELRERMPPWEPLPMCSIGRWILTSDYEWHFEKAIAGAEDWIRSLMEAERDRVLSECRAIDGRRAAAEEALGIAGLEQQYQHRLERLWAVREQIMNAKAKTPAGLEIQLTELREALFQGEDDPHNKCFNNVISALREMALEGLKSR
jgi:hypothetical protein